jgi:demethylspheroidene O-methyltransferase
MDLFDLCAGFVYSQILAACCALDLFRRLGEGPLSAIELAARHDLDPDAALRLLDAATAIGLTRRLPDGRFAPGRHGAAILGDPTIAPMVRHHALLYRDLADPLALFGRQRPATELARFWGYARAAAPDSLDPGAVDPYGRLMAATQPAVAEQVMGAHRLDRHAHLLDVGGGEGAFLAAVAAACPKLRLSLFDLPATVARAGAALTAQGLGDRVARVGGDFARDPLPPGADIATLVRVLLDHDDDTVVTLLTAVHRALAPGGTVLIAEPLGGDGAAGRVGDAYFGVYLLAMGGGRVRRFEAVAALLARAGFVDHRRRPTALPMLASVVTARKPVNQLSI